MIRSGESFVRCVVPLRYEGAVRDAILRFKFGGMDSYAPALGGILAQCIRGNLDGTYDLVTWVPVSRKRLKQRGYDQARLLAEAAAQVLGASAVPILEKQTDNPAQSGISDPEARRRNVRNVYRVMDPAKIAGMRILLIDDVITTGSTMDEAARTLRKTGAKQVVAAALACPPDDTGRPKK